VRALILRGDLKVDMRNFFLSLWERIEVRAFFMRGDLKEL